MIVHRWHDEPKEVNVGDHLAYASYDAVVISLDEDTKTGMACEVKRDGVLGEPYKTDELGLWYGKTLGELNPPGTQADDFMFIPFRDNPELDPPDES